MTPVASARVRSLELGRLRLAISFRTRSNVRIPAEGITGSRLLAHDVARSAASRHEDVRARRSSAGRHDFLVDLDARASARCPPTLCSCAVSFVRSRAEERDIGAAFLSESRTSLLGGMPSVAGDASSVARLLLQKNATFNQEFRETIEPLLASFITRRTAVLRLRRLTSPCTASSSVAPGMFYNLGGKVALSRSPWDAHLFPSRVHDEDGRITLLLLQAQIEERSDQDVAIARPVFDSSQSLYRRADGIRLAGRRSIRFECLHTAFHVPEPRRSVCRRARPRDSVMRGRPEAQPVQCARFGVRRQLLF